jgi:nitroreductase
MDLNDAIQSRKSAKSFTDKKPDWRDIIECIDSARYAPMAGNNYSLKFILINDEETIQKLAEFAQQDFIAKAHYVVVACTSSSRTTNLFGKRGEIYCRQQAGAAIENFLLSIEAKGLSTCWIGHFEDKSVKKELGIPDDFDVEAFFPVGYEKKIKGERKKVKIDLNNILYFEKYGNKRMKKKEIIDA